MLGNLNERATSLEEVGEAVNEMKSVKAPGLDGFLVECLTLSRATSSVTYYWQPTRPFGVKSVTGFIALLER